MHRRPETSFSERDLVDLALDAGFVEIHMELHLDIVRGTMTDWELFLDLTPLPKTPNLRQILAAHFSSQERALFERNMRPRIESGEALSSEVTAYLTALKPSVSVP